MRSSFWIILSSMDFTKQWIVSELGVFVNWIDCYLEGSESDVESPMGIDAALTLLLLLVECVCA